MDVLSLTPKLPDDFISLCNGLFSWSGYLFVWRDVSGIKTAYCTECGNEMIIDINAMKTVTPKDRILYGKRHNQFCNCPKCGKSVIYKDKNRGRGKLWEENYLYYFQALPDGGMVLRTFYLHKSFEWQIKDVEVEYSEHHRVYFYQGSWYRYRRYPKGGSPYFAFCSWYNADIAEKAFYWQEIERLNTPTPWAGRMYSSFHGEIAYAIHNDVFKGDFRYSCLEEYLKTENRSFYNSPLLTVVEYLARFQKNPGLTEKMAKQGFMAFLHSSFYLKARNGIFNWNKPDVYSSLGLSKGTVRKLEKPTAKQLFRCQLNEVYGLTPQNADYIIKNSIHDETDIKAWAGRLKKERPANINKLIKYYRKQKITFFQDYTDYIRQLEQLGMPVEENRFPHNFKAAHDALTVEIQRRAMKKKLDAARREQKKFEEKYKELLDRLMFEDEKLIVRPARGDEELLQESNALSHCVYSNYRELYRNLQTIICVIRKKDSPEVPFYTLEINPSYTRVIQCRGKGNCGTTPEVEAFKNKWFRFIQSNHKEEKQCRKTA